MKTFIITILLIGCFTNAEFTEEDDVIVLTGENFDDALAQFEYIMVEFYAPWCGHCKKFAPDYSKVAVELKKKGEGYVPVAKIDATAYEPLAQKYSIQGFPTIKFFTKALGPDQPINYEGARTFEDVIAWINKKTGPPTELLTTLEQVRQFVEKASTQPVGVFFGTEESDSDLETYKTVASAHEKVLFGHTFNAEARAHYNVGENVKVVLFKGFEEKRNNFEETFEVAALQTFFSVNSIPSLLPFNDKAISVIFQQQNTALFLFANENDESIAAFDEFSSVAASFKDKVKFSYSKPNDGFGLFGRLAEYVGADQTNLPNLMLVVPSQESAKYKFTFETITAENIKAFLNNFLEGKLDRFLKSEEIPETNDQPVKVIVGKQFQELVIDNDQDVLIEFYAPWCGHCKALAPIYEQVATLIAGNTKIVIAKCDATANEVPGVEIQSFPTLKFWKNGQKDRPIAFSGERDLQGILKFLEENTSHPWIVANEGSVPKQEDL